MNELQSHVEYQKTSYSLERYPKTQDAALRAWSNAEILALNYFAENYIDVNTTEVSKVSSVYLYHDRFGVWNCLLDTFIKTDKLLAENVNTIISYASQQKAVQHNLKLNSLTKIDDKAFISPLDDIVLNNSDNHVVLMKVPKALDLFELYLQQLHKAVTHKQVATNNIEVVCCFMTKYFTKSLLDIATRYFDGVEQSQAWKKSRLLVLSKPKTIDSADNYYPSLVKEINYKDNSYKQYSGVFSADKIDIGTQFLLDQFNNGKLQVKKSELNILDLACGNGVIARELAKQANVDAKFTLVDDFALAVASSNLNMAANINSLNFTCVCDDNLQALEAESFDLVISNPPFHFEHENNSEVSLTLFDDVYRVLKKGKRFILVANKHLDYKVYLDERFTKVFVIDTNRKFAIYECIR